MLPDRVGYTEQIERLFPAIRPDGTYKRVLTITFQVTTDCSLRCTYCYQINKGHEMMSWDVAKAALDYIFDSAEDPSSMMSYDKVSALIIDFIGGEPLLNIELITKIIEYCEVQFIERNSPWVLLHKYNFSTNGVAYFEPKVQELLSKYRNVISMGVTVDGYKELHDKCRLFPNGDGSYDIALSASLDQKNRFGNDSTKITLCPANVAETSKAIINMLELGYVHVAANCVFEEGWNNEHANILYEEMKLIGDYVLEHDLEDSCAISLFNDTMFAPLSENDTENWCGGTGSMLAVDYRGLFYPCIRYMDSSIGSKYPPLIVGNIHEGVYATEETKALREELLSVTRQSQSPEKCLTCQVASGCAWCSGYNYQIYGTVNKRATFICIMHKARALGNYYYWKKEAKKKQIPCTFQLHLPEADAVEIIGREEYDRLLSL